MALRQSATIIFLPTFSLAPMSDLQDASGSASAESSALLSSRVPSTRLRPLLGPSATKAFPDMSVADVAVDWFELEARMFPMTKALVAHDALNRCISPHMKPTETLPGQLSESITVALSKRLIDQPQAAVLRKINTAANKAKHSRFMPF